MRKLIETLGTATHRLLTIGAAKSHSFPRYKMYESIGRQAADMRFAGPALSISHSTHLLAMIGADSGPVTEGNYPEVSLTKLPFPDGSFGLVVSDQVFEHVDGLPSVAMSESLRVLAPGGWVLHTTCFCTAYHGPGDFWRFTAEGLKSLALRCGAKQAFAETQGHPVEPLVNLLGWTRLHVPASKAHPLNWLARLDRPSYGTTVWVMAQKG